MIDLCPWTTKVLNSSLILLLWKPEVLYCICIGEILWRCKKEKNLCIIVEKKSNFCIVVGFHYSAYIIVIQIGKLKNHQYFIESLSIYSIFENSRLLLFEITNKSLDSIFIYFSISIMKIDNFKAKIFNLSTL